MNQQTCINHVVSSLNHRRHHRRRHATLCQPPPPPLHRERAPPFRSKQIAGNYAYTIRGTTPLPALDRSANNSLCSVPARAALPVSLSQPLPSSPARPVTKAARPRPPRDRPARAHHSHVVHGRIGSAEGAAWRQLEFCRASDISAHGRVLFVGQVAALHITFIEVNFARRLYNEEWARRVEGTTTTANAGAQFPPLLNSHWHIRKEGRTFSLLAASVTGSFFPSLSI